MQNKIRRLVMVLTFLLSPVILFSQNNILDQSEKMIENKKYDQAIELLSQKEERFSSNAQYFYLLGIAHIDKLSATEDFFKKGTIASKAKIALLKAIELQPSHVKARIRLCNYYFNAPAIAGGSNTKAMAQVTEIIKYDELIGRKLLADIYLDKKEYKAGEQEYLKVLKLEPDDKKIRYWLSNVYFNMEQYDKAFEYVNKSIKKFPNYLTAYYQYGRIASVSKKNIRKGVSSVEYYLKKATDDSKPKKHWAYYRLGLLKNEQGKMQEAQKAFKKALELKPEFSQVKKMVN